MSRAYFSVQEFRTLMNKKTANSDADDARVRVLVEAVSDYIDQFCARTFQPKIGAQTFIPEWGDKLTVDDLLSVTEIATDLDHDGTYETIWTSADYFLAPLNAPFNGRPYTAIHQAAEAVNYIPYRGVSWPTLRVTGTWGFSNETTPFSQLNGALNTTVTTVTLDDEVEVGWTILVGSEQMYVTARDTTGLIATVERAVNGTTAASHLDNAVVAKYDYPSAIVQAAVLHAGRVWRRKENPTGIINTPGDIGWRAVYIPRFDSDTQAFLGPYRRKRVM